MDYYERRKKFFSEFMLELEKREDWSLTLIELWAMTNYGFGNRIVRSSLKLWEDLGKIKIDDGVVKLL